MATLAHDFRFAARMLAKDRGFTILAVLTLALGIGANGTLFSWINSTLLNPAPGATGASELVSVMRGERSEHPSPPFSYLDYKDLRDGNHTLSGMLAYHHDYVSLTGAGKPERIYAVLSSAGYFDVLGVRPVLGRGFLRAEENAHGAAVAVLSYALWQSHFGGDRAVIGKIIEINRHPYTIIGVTPSGFQGCMPGLRADVWIPLGMDQPVWGSNRPDDRGISWLNVLGRLEPGVSAPQAESELNGLMQRIAEQSPDIHRGANQITLDPLWRSPFGINVYLYRSLPMLLALAVVLLLLACANVANLLLVRAVGRRREIAIRLSVGATRWQLVRQLMIESLLLAVAGGAVAIAITSWTAGTFAAFVPPIDLPLTVNGHMDSGVVLVTMIASIVTAVIFGTLPAWRSTSVPLVTSLKEEAGSTSLPFHKTRLLSTLAVAQISLSLLLLVCAGLFTRSLQNIRRADPGFDPAHVALASYQLGPSGYSGQQGLVFDRQVLAKVQALAEVESATLADFSPLNFTIHSDGVEPEGYTPRLHETMEVDRATVGPDYLRTLRTSLVAGREFTAADNKESQRVIMVNEAFIARYWPGEDAIGKRVSFQGQWWTVVGVASNAKYRRIVYAPAPAIFLPLFQDYEDPVIIHARVSGDPRAYTAALEKAVHDLNPDLPVFSVNTLASSMQGSLLERVSVVFAGAFGLLAVVLAGIGIYGVVAYTTRQRTREIGIRMALGAERGQVFRMILRRGLRLVIIGLALGLAASVLLTRLLRGLLFGVPASDPVTFTSVALLLTGVALAACYVPARRAAKVDPLLALHSE
jgi:predicted permease